MVNKDIAKLTFLLLKKMAKADRNISADEKKFIVKKLGADKSQIDLINKELDSTKTIDSSYIDIAKKIVPEVSDRHLLKTILRLLAELIFADNKEHSKETKMFDQIGKVFGFSQEELDNILEHYRE